MFKCIKMLHGWCGKGGLSVAAGNESSESFRQRAGNAPSVPHAARLEHTISHNIHSTAASVEFAPRRAAQPGRATPDAPCD